MPRSIGAALALAVLIGPAALSAQESPRQVAAAFLDAWNTQRWGDAARLLDTDLFDRFRKDFVDRAARGASDGPRLTVEDLRRRDPGMPLSVAEYQVRMMEEQRSRFADPTPYEFARVANAAALRGLSPAEAAARWLESRDPRWQVSMQFERAGCRPPEDVDQIARSTRRLIGVVADGDSVTYAVFSEEWPGAAAAPSWAGGNLSVIQLSRSRGAWRIVPRADLLPEVGSVDVGDCRGGRFE